MTSLADVLSPLAVVVAAVVGPAVPVYLSRRKTRHQLDKVVGQVETVQRVVNGEHARALALIVDLERRNEQLLREIALMADGLESRLIVHTEKSGTDHPDASTSTSPAR